MVSGPQVTAAWRVLDIRTEETTSGYQGANMLTPDSRGNPGCGLGPTNS
jgi:hypothetical protein